jgi:diguanylate cyclase
METLLARTGYDQNDSRALGRAASDGLDRGEFFVAYQPLVDAQTGHLEGFEALARWDRPGLGVRRPGSFLSALVTSGLLAPLTDFVLAAACASAVGWPDCGGRPPRLRINLCAAELVDPLLPGRVWRALAVSGLDPERLVLELAGGPLPDVGAAQQTCSQLGALGISTALDGYGVDETSLDWVRSLGCDEIKLAKSLVKDVSGPTEAVAVVGCIIDLAKSLGLPVTVDGIESNEQLRLLLPTGARVLQGFHFGVPSRLADSSEVVAADLRVHALVAAGAR